jgi:hypothetical protein
MLEGGLQRALEAAAVTCYMFLFLLIGPASLALLVYGLLTPLWPLSLLYATWWLWDLRTAATGGRAWAWVAWCRRWRIWCHMANYFPATIVKTADLDPTNNHIICVHPHGILCFGATACLGSEGAQFGQLFPGLRPRVTTLAGSLLMPAFREMFLLSGAVSSSRASIDCLLARPGGEAPVLMVGGVPEMSNPDPTEVRLYLSKRLGFAKLALRHGASLVPCLVLGETGLYRQDGALVRAWERATAGLRDSLGIAPVIFSGSGWLQEGFGLLPRRRALRVVVGAPLAVARRDPPGEEEVLALHQRYVAALTQLYSKHNTEEGVKLVIT